MSDGSLQRVTQLITQAIFEAPSRWLAFMDGSLDAVRVPEVFAPRAVLRRAIALACNNAALLRHAEQGQDRVAQSLVPLHKVGCDASRIRELGLPTRRAPRSCSVF